MMQISKGNLFWGFLLEACLTNQPSNLDNHANLLQTCQELICMVIKPQASSSTDYGSKPELCGYFDFKN
jgi:hypothetical protein